MKHIGEKLVELLRTGYCTPQIARIAKRLKEPSATVHYNIRKLEKEGVVSAYKAVLDYAKAGQGFSAFVLLTLSPDEYGNPERIGRELAKVPEVESVDIITGDWEIAMKVRVADQQRYYELVRNVISRKGVVKIKSLTSLKELKTEFVRR